MECLSARPHTHTPAIILHEDFVPQHSLIPRLHSQVAILCCGIQPGNKIDTYYMLVGEDLHLPDLGWCFGDNLIQWEGAVPTVPSNKKLAKVCALR